MCKNDEENERLELDGFVRGDEDLRESVEEIDSEIRKELWQCLALFLIALSILGLAYSSFLIPEAEKPETWFQRSGSIAVIFAIWIELKLFSISGYVNSAGAVVIQQEVMIIRYGSLHRWAKYIAACLAIFGTLIWSYGDLVV